MTRPTRRLAAPQLLLAAALTALALPAEELVVELDPAATDVTFDVDATGHDVHGTLALREGTIRFDPATGAASGDLVVDATSAQTGNGNRDKTMHDKVLESVRFPLFTFHAREVVGELAEAGESSLEIRGTVEMHGAEHPLTLPATVRRTGDRLSAETHFAIPYVEWGLHNPGFLFLRVADEVQVAVETEATVGTAAATATAPATASVQANGEETGHDGR